MPPHCSSNQRLGDTTTSYMRLLILLFDPYLTFIGNGWDLSKLGLPKCGRTN
jgi:hypothetical protein